MRAPRTPLSLGSGRSGFSQRPASFGVKLPLLPREAHRRAEAALSLGPRSVNRAVPAAISLGPGDFETFHSPPSVSLTGGTQSSAGVSRVARRVAPATDGTLRELSGLHPETTLWRLGLRRLRPSGPHSPTQGTGVAGGRRTPAGGVLGRRGTAPPLLRLREAGLGLAGPGSSRTPADGELVIPRLRDRPRPQGTPASGRGGRSRRWCGSRPRRSRAQGLGRDSQGRPRSPSPQH